MPKSINDFFIANGTLLKDQLNFDALFKKFLIVKDLSSKTDDDLEFQSKGRGIISRIVLTQSFK